MNSRQKAGSTHRSKYRHSGVVRLKKAGFGNIKNRYVFAQQAEDYDSTKNRIGYY